MFAFERPAVHYAFREEQRLISHNLRTTGVCARCGRAGGVHLAAGGGRGECCTCLGCKRVRLHAAMWFGEVAFWVRLHRGQVRLVAPRRRFVRSVGRLLRFPCPEGTHRGRRQRDGAVVCHLCGKRKAS